MPDGVVPRALHYVGLLLLLSLASTFPWWLAAQVARAEYRRLLSALACSMRLFFYSICLLCILVGVRSVHLLPDDPRSMVLSWIHLGGTVLISGPSAWRAFRTKGPRLAVILVVGWAGCLGLGALAAALSPAFRQMLLDLPRYLTTA